MNIDCRICGVKIPEYFINFPYGSGICHECFGLVPPHIHGSQFDKFMEFRTKKLEKLVKEKHENSDSSRYPGKSI